MMDQFELGVEADVTSSGVDSVRLVAGEAQPNNLGYLRLRLLRFGDDARGKSLRVNLVGGIKLPRSSVYVKGTVISSSGIATGTKFKSQVRPSQPTTVVAALAMPCTALRELCFFFHGFLPFSRRVAG